MGNTPPPYPPPPPGPPYGGDWKYQRRILKDQERARRDYARAQRDAYRYQYQSMRRTSILGPILLITIGILFLLVQTGRLESQRLWAWYGHFWPALLVIAGVILLLEWGFDQFFHSGPPYYRRRIGGGVFFLLLLLAISGVGIHGMHEGRDNFMRGLHLNQDNLDEFLGDKHESDQTFNQAFPENASLTIDNPRGDVTISGESDDNQIHVSVHKEVYTSSDSDAETKANRLSPSLNTNGNAVTLTVPSIQGARADITITVPPAAAPTVTTNRGDVRISAIKAPVTVTANHGDIDLSAITGPVTAHINNGESSFSAHSITGALTIEGRGHDTTLSDLSGPVMITGDFFGTSHFEHIRGPIKFHTSRTDLQVARLDGEIEIGNEADLSVSEAVGPLALTTYSRNITLDRVSGDISVTNRNGSVDVTSAPPIGNLTIQNRNGSVDVTLPEKASFTVQADTTNGDVDNEFSLPESGNDNHKSFSGTVGSGGPTLHISTTQNDISLKRASVMPLPPKPPAPPPISIKSSDGSSVYVGKDGVRITSGADGSSVIVGKDGLRINSNADGGSTYTAKDGTRLTSNADGSYVYHGKDGLSFTSNADGSVVYIKGNIKITTDADGSRRSTGNLSDSQIRDRIQEARREVKRTEAQRDAERVSNLNRRNEN